jgi:hypothetical protein
MMKPETFEQVTALLPELVDRTRTLAEPGAPNINPIEAWRRYRVLNRIEGLLMADGATWADLAAQLVPPGHRPGDLMSMTAVILQSGQDLTEHAKDFLADLRAQARQSEGVPLHLTPRQVMWLQYLHARALARQARQQQAQGAVSNVVILHGRAGTGKPDHSESNGTAKGSA